METAIHSRTISRALTTVNAPLPFPIDGQTLVACLRLVETDMRWRPHVRAFFRETGLEVVMDMVVEGTVTFDNLSKAIHFWNVEEDFENARWIREMAPVTVANADAADVAGNRFRLDS